MFHLVLVLIFGFQEIIEHCRLSAKSQNIAEAGCFHLYEGIGSWVQVIIETEMIQVILNIE